MGLFDNLVRQSEAIAEKTGISSDQVQSIGTSIQSKLGGGCSRIEALEAVAREHGLPVDKILEVLGHAGSAQDADEDGGIFRGLLRP